MAAAPPGVRSRASRRRARICRRAVCARGMLPVAAPRARRPPNRPPSRVGAGMGLIGPTDPDLP